MTEVENTLMAICDLNEISPGQDLILVQDKPQLTQVVVHLGCECQDWAQVQLNFRLKS